MARRWSRPKMSRSATSTSSPRSIRRSRPTSGHRRLGARHRPARRPAVGPAWATAAPCRLLLGPVLIAGGVHGGLSRRWPGADHGQPGLRLSRGASGGRRRPLLCRDGQRPGDALRRRDQQRRSGRGDGCGPTAVAPLGDGRSPSSAIARRSWRGFPGTARSSTSSTATATAAPFSNPNAAVSDGKGGVYFSSSGSFSPGARATGAVLHLDASGRSRRVAEGIHYANGVAVTPDGRTLYVSEHLGRRVLAFDIADDGRSPDAPDLRRARRSRRSPIRSGAGRSARTGSLSTATAISIIAEYGAGRLLVVDTDGRLDRHASGAGTLRHRLGLQRRADAPLHHRAGVADRAELGRGLRDRLPDPGACNSER